MRIHLPIVVVAIVAGAWWWKFNGFTVDNIDFDSVGLLIGDSTEFELSSTTRRADPGDVVVSVD